MEIIQERLEREYDLDLIFTAPSVEYEVTLTDGSGDRDRQPGGAAGPDQDLRKSASRGCRSTFSRPPSSSAQVMDLVTQRRGEFKAQEYLDHAARAVELSHPAGRDPDRLLQRSEGAHARLRQPGLPFRGLSAGRHGAAGRAGEQGPGRRAEHDRAPRPDVQQRACGWSAS